MKETPLTDPLVFNADEITKALLQLSESMKALNNSRLSRKALVALIHDQRNEAGTFWFL